MMEDLESTGFRLHRRGARKGTKERGWRSGEGDKTVCYQGCTEKGDPKGWGRGDEQCSTAPERQITAMTETCLL